jgi:hypothetical protein
MGIAAMSLRWREWRDLSLEKRLASIERPAPAPAPSPRADIRQLIKDGPPVDPVQSARTRRWVKAYGEITRELEREAEQAATDQRDARTEFRKTGIGQLFR